MPTLNSDVTVNSYNNFYLFSMKYLYRNDSIWKFVAIFCHTTSLIPSCPPLIESDRMKRSSVVQNVEKLLVSASFLTKKGLEVCF